MYIMLCMSRLLKMLLLMNYISLAIKQKQQTKKINIELQNSIARLSFLCHIRDIKIA